MTPEGKRDSLSRDDWIEAATQTLVQMSIDGIKVELLAKDLGVSRGSFYWHFKGRDELLMAILIHWRERQTRRIIDRIREDQKLSAEERLTRLRMIPPHTQASRDAASLELAIRAWARRSRMAREVVSAVDGERLEFSRLLLEEAGGDPATAHNWALIGHAYILGEAMLRENLDEAEIADCRATLLHAQLTALREKGATTAPTPEVPGSIKIQEG